MNIEDKNYYEILEIPTTSTQEEIHQAYIRSRNAYAGESAALYSLLTEEDCANILSAIEEAYSVLGAPEKRTQYDRARGFGEHVHHRPAPTSSLADLISQSNETNSHSYQKDQVSAHDLKREEFRKQEFQYSSIQNKSTASRAEAYSKFSLDYPVNEEMEQEIENTTEFTGSFLQRIREYKKVSVERMAEMTKVSKTHIRNIESDNYSKLPAFVYVRGFVFQYAKCLKLNPDLVCKSYLEHLKTVKQQES